MSIDSIGGYSSSLSLTYGTDSSSQLQSSSAAQNQDSLPMDKQTFGAAVVSKTLDYMNSGGLGGGNNSDYDFQTKVLEGGLAAKGLMVNDKV